MRQVLGPGASEKEVRNFGRAAFRSSTFYFVDLIYLSSHRKEMLDKVEVTGLVEVKKIIASGQGIVFASAHYGNPEIGVLAGIENGINVVAPAEVLAEPGRARVMRALREKIGDCYLDIGHSALAKALTQLRRGGCLAIAADRNVVGAAVDLPFFGRETKVSLGAAEIAARTGAALVPTCCRRTAKGFELCFEPALPLVLGKNERINALATTSALLTRFEDWIRVDPGQWFVLERRWP
jgi:KDO2-lipid IV(A) lauroyltransferase